MSGPHEREADAYADEIADLRKELARLRAEKAELVSALEPFADIGVWLFARDIPDDTPLVTVSLINGAGCHLTRGMFKAAHLARAQAEPHDSEGETG